MLALDKKDLAKANEILGPFGHKLQSYVSRTVSLRVPLEARWVQDLAQYRGEDDPSVASRLRRKPNRSRVFVNITRTKCNAAESRLSEMLLPTDSRNWSLEPTPVPMMMQGEEGADARMEAMKRAKAMQREIDDQLTEARFNEVCRQVIHDGVVFGTGILKAPTVTTRVRKMWRKMEDVHVLSIVRDIRPAVEKIDVWNFFPDMSAKSLDDAEFILERKFLLRRQLVQLASLPGYIPDQIRKVLAMDPEETHISSANHLAQLQAMSGIQTNFGANRYELWEYHGPVPGELLKALGLVRKEDELRKEMEAIVLFCANHIIRVELNPLETGERPYSIFVYERDDASMFGFGVPYLLRHNQRITNAGWRAMMENMGLSIAPQIVINRHMVEPADGEWSIAPYKLWYVTDPSVPPNAAFGAFTIDSRQPEIMNILSVARQLADDETNLPILGQGQIQGAPPEAASALSMMANAANSVLRRVVKSFDDGILSPTIRRFYDYNMSYNPKEEIKGDFAVKPHGSSTLLVKETQAFAIQSLLQLASTPVFGPMTRMRELYRKAVELMHLPPDEIVKTEEEMQQEGSQQGPPPEVQLEMQKLQMQAQLQQAKLEFEAKRHQDLMADREANRQAKLAIEQMRREEEMMKLAAEQNISLEKIKAQLGEAALRERNKRELQQNEMEIKQTFGSGI